MTRTVFGRFIITTLIVILSTVTTPVYADADGPGDLTCDAPSEPVISLDKKTAWSISFNWECESGADRYLIYASENRGKSYKLVSTISENHFIYGRKYKTVPGKSYTFYVEAVNGEGSSAASMPSAEHTWKLNKAPTFVTDIRYTASPKSRHVYKDIINIRNRAGRELKLQLHVNGAWKTKKTIKLKSSYDKMPLTVVFPNIWWKEEKTRWRFVINKNSNATSYKSRTITLKTKKYYQNPSKYVQLKNRISKHGYGYYTSPVLTDNSSTKKDHIEAMIKTAYRYLGDPFVVGRSRAPGKGLDCSGIVMQACYGAGVDLWPSNPHRHRFPRYEYESRNIAKMKTLKTVPIKSRKRGDLIFYSRRGVVIHVAIYLGKNRIIHSYPPRVMVTDIHGWGKICKVKRIFN